MPTLLIADDHPLFREALRGAVSRVIDFSARMVEDAQRLSTHIRRVADLMREANYWARQSGHGTVAAPHVQQAMDAQIRRHDRVRSELNEAILRALFLKVNPRIVDALVAHALAGPAVVAERREASATAPATDAVPVIDAVEGETAEGEVEN